MISSSVSILTSDGAAASTLTSESILGPLWGSSVEESVTAVTVVSSLSYCVDESTDIDPVETLVEDVGWKVDADEVVDGSDGLLESPACEGW
jgi:hypothetical protein